MTNLTYKSGGRLEEIGSYARARRVGPFVYVAGTTAIEPTGKLHAPNDAYAQSIYILGRIEEALKACGAELRHVVRTRAYVTSLPDHGPGFVRAHGEVFKGIDREMGSNWMTGSANCHLPAPRRLVSLGM